MGVPALFRWLTKKYPKVVMPVVEEEEEKFPGEDGREEIKPINYAALNPNGIEFDNLYLDMNGIVHPCTHPEGKPAPETEEEMMIEVFKYTERVVNMIRPRKLLMIAIDGVAPRAKMNQQRSRRFRASQEAKEKEKEREENLVLWESMGKTVTEETRNKESWDSNAITPGTPFMDLLARSLRYWVVQKMNTDPGWKQLEVIISDASVPGEGEHKIMDFIRRQRVNPGHDPNTQHVIYGLDADLIMLSLATHEPNFRVLREDVFFQDTSTSVCRICGQNGHYAAQCTGEKKQKADEHDTKDAPVVKKPFVFLDVSILREYLEIELDVKNLSFSFDFERAIDDWVLLIFFVGNDFLPHLPSLEIREGAIDKLLRIWKTELPRMGGYITNNGTIDYTRAEIILEGLARLEDEIFRNRHEAEQRQDQNAKRRKLEAESRNSFQDAKPSPSLQLSASTTVTAASAITTGPHGLPPRPNFDSFGDFESRADSLGLGAPDSGSAEAKAVAVAAITGTVSDWVDKRREIRMANLSAAEMLKAEMMSAVPVNPAARKKFMAQKAASMKVDVVTKTEASAPAESRLLQSESQSPVASISQAESQVQLPPSDSRPTDAITSPVEPQLRSQTESQSTDASMPSEDDKTLADPAPEPDQLEQPVTHSEGTPVNGDTSPHGVKRKADELNPEGEDDDNIGIASDEDADSVGETDPLLLIKHPDGSVYQEDNVRLFEPGYRERYYKTKFDVESSDVEFRKRITKSYIEGLAWVLQYYYQGTPSWTWYYPYHFAPFAQDFVEVAKMDIKFDKGQPFKPLEQLMGVFPPASRKHIPEVFHSLMTDPDSPIIDFYPETFKIDMNGKRMQWQGVALLPFIDEERLLEAMNTCYPNLTEEEVRQNQWGSNVLYVADEHPLYPLLEGLYAKRKDDKPVQIDHRQSRGLNGSLLPDPNCVPGSTYESPLVSRGLEDISGDRSLAALYFFPKQVSPHRSVLLPGARRPPRVLTNEDLEAVRFGRRPNNNYRRPAGFNAINSGRENGRGGPPRNGYNSSSSNGAYGGDSRSSYGGSYGGGYGGYGGYGNGTGTSHYGDRGLPPPPPPRPRDDYSRSSSYGAPPSRSMYHATPMADYGRTGNASHYGGSANGYSRPAPASYSSAQIARYGGSGGYGGYNQTSSYSQSHNNSSGYGGGSRSYYGNDGNARGGGATYEGAGSARGGGAAYGGYGSGRGGVPSSYGSYGRGGAPPAHYSSPTSYGGYGRGGPPPSSSYSARGRGYGRY